MPFIIAAIALQAALVIHAIKTGRDRYWIYILLIFPLIGGIAYFVVELLPELAGSRRVRRARKQVTSVIDPDRDLRHAVKGLQVADTVENAMAVARGCLARNQFQEAYDLLTRHRSGIHGADPGLLSLLAEAEFGLERFDDVIATLDHLKAENPDLRSGDLHLLYARAKEQSGDVDGAMHEYQALAGYYYGPEPVCRLAELHLAKGEADTARDLYDSVLAESEHADRAYHKRHKHWIDQARQRIEH